MITPVTPDLIRTTLDLHPLPQEGGLWTQSWRTEDFSTIYYLLERPDFSAWHRLDFPEVYAYHAGDPLTLHTLGDGGLVQRTLGVDLAAGERPQAVVPAGTWQASESAGWTLVSTVVVPAYTDECVEFSGDLAERFPEHAGLVARLSR
ncbi:cupin domain-containing protein [Actinokineospora bangkokensis]|uniref:DUF985 domain-containing protein n=1 Tax=Actinokineospora bangkokensis TaxID=1193682 RepID=A0A1Q9LS81_9PSEU|nr:cupin domain-containing protein [Actinokineospora bangkokensis]OLR94870.1 hypothetical protein BJP25_09625 [Actinokineospora bangkokensis]